MFVQYNPNPYERNVGDCTVRAMSKALKISWEKAYAKLCVQGFNMCDMPSANSVWGSLLRQEGFYRKGIPNECPDCYTVKDFCEEHKKGVYVLALPGHVVTIVDGDYFDTFDSGDSSPLYYFYRNEE